MKERERLLGRLEDLRPAIQRLFAQSAPADLREELGGITLHQFDVLRRLAASPSGTLTMRQLADCQGVGPSAATQMVDRLIRDGLVERFADEEDRRIVRVRSTPRSAAMISRFTAAHHEVGRRVLAPLSDAELAHFVALAERVVDGAPSTDEGAR